MQSDDDDDSFARRFNIKGLGDEYATSTESHLKEEEEEKEYDKARPPVESSNDDISNDNTVSSYF